MTDPDFYRRQSESTDPGEYLAFYRDLPSSPEAILRHLSDILLSSFPLEGMTESQKRDIEVERTRDILKALHERGNPFTSKGPRETRFVGLCYHWSLLAASVLRSRGFACRLRCGFAPYLKGGEKGIDHTAIELWEPDAGRWRLMDPELVAVEPQASTRILGIDEPLDPLNVSPQQFHLAARAWMNYRCKRVPDGFYGLYADEPSYGFVRTSLIRDWLNILARERNVSYGPPLKGLDPTQERAYLDEIASLMLDPAKNRPTLEALSRDIDLES